MGLCFELSRPMLNIFSLKQIYPLGLYFKIMLNVYFSRYNGKIMYTTKHWLFLANQTYTRMLSWEKRELLREVHSREEEKGGGGETKVDGELRIFLCLSSFLHEVIASLCMSFDPQLH